jgi:hypothetical protein
MQAVIRAAEQNRTVDTRIFSPLLYRLSYSGTSRLCLYILRVFLSSPGLADRGASPTVHAQRCTPNGARPTVHAQRCTPNGALSGLFHVAIMIS